METSITDFQRRVVEPMQSASWWQRSRRDAYLGVVQIPVKAHLGVDLNKVRVSQRDNRLIVGGLKMIVMTDTAAGATWLLDEVRTEYIQRDAVVSFRGKTHDGRTRELSREHESQVRSRLKEGQDFKVFEAGLIRTTQQVIRSLLGPLGKDVLFENVSDETALTLKDFLNTHNQQLGSAVSKLKQLGNQ